VPTLLTNDAIQSVRNAVRRSGTQVDESAGAPAVVIELLPGLTRDPPATGSGPASVGRLVSGGEQRSSCTSNDRSGGHRSGTGVLAAPADYVGARIELAGDAPTPGDMASAVSGPLGVPVRHVEVPISAVGNPEMAAMWRFLRGAGYAADIGDLQRAHPEVGWTSFADWADRTFTGGGH
jgi:hypothetical protein